MERRPAGAQKHAGRPFAFTTRETAQELEIKVNSPVFHVYREFFDADEKLVYSTSLVYPGDGLEFNIEFAVESVD